MKSFPAMLLLLVLASSSALAGELDESVWSASPVATADTEALSSRALEFRSLLGAFLQQGTATVRRFGGAFLPEDLQPGLQFSIDPDTDEVFVGWRFQF